MSTYDPGTGFSSGDPFGSRPGGSNGNDHFGTDYPAAAGTPIPSAATGVVYYNGIGTGFGNTVILYHGQNAVGEDVYTVYAHMQAASSLVIGETVQVGDFVGNVGSTGTGGVPNGQNHLHFEILAVPEDGRHPLPGSGSTGLFKNKHRQDPATFDSWPEGSQELPPPELRRRGTPTTGSSSTRRTETSTMMRTATAQAPRFFSRSSTTPPPGAH